MAGFIDVRISDHGLKSRNKMADQFGYEMVHYARPLFINKKNFMFLLFIKRSSLVTFPDIKWPVLLMSGYQKVIRLSKSGLSLNEPFNNHTCMVIRSSLYKNNKSIFNNRKRLVFG